MRSRALVAWVAAGLALALVPASAAARDAGADGHFDERTSSHFRLLQDVDIDRASGWSGSVHFERQVLGILETGYDRLDEFLGLRPDRRLTVLVYDPGIFDARFAGLFRFPAAGFYGGQIRVRGDVRVTTGLERTLWHELVHAAFDAAAPSLVLPAWLNEGVAEWFEARVAGQRRLTPGEYGALQRAARGGALPPLASLATPSFAGLDGSRAALAYLYSRGLVDYMARRHGERELRRLCRTLVEDGDVDRAFRRIYRDSPEDLDAAFREELG